MSLTCRQLKTHLAIPGLIMVLVLTIASCNSHGNSGAAERIVHDPASYPGADMLVSVDWLAANLDDPNLRLVDLSPIRTYEDGHLPTASHVWWEDTIEPNNNIYGMLAWDSGVQQIVRETGITEDSVVVAYDDNGGQHAARVIWMLHAIGFENASLLHGGRGAWEGAGHELTTDTPDLSEGGLPEEVNYDVLIGADDVQAAIDDPAAVIIDGRTGEERRETWFDRLRVGSIPGSIHLPRDATLQPDEPRSFKSPDEILDLLPDNLEPGAGRPVIVYGLHGVAAAHTWFTMRLLGFENVRMYDGSWAEWGADPNRPIEEL